MLEDVNNTTEDLTGNVTVKNLDAYVEAYRASKAYAEEAEKYKDAAAQEAEVLKSLGVKNHGGYTLALTASKPTFEFLPSERRANAIQKVEAAKKVLAEATKEPEEKLKAAKAGLKKIEDEMLESNEVKITGKTKPKLALRSA